MKFKQLVLVEFRNCSPFVYNMVSDKPITIDKVCAYFEKTEDFDESRDSLSFLDDITEIKI